MPSKTIQITASLSILAVKEMETAEALAEARTPITVLAPLVVATATVPVNSNRRVELLEVSIHYILEPRSFLISKEATGTPKHYRITSTKQTFKQTSLASVRSTHFPATAPAVTLHAS
jgi:hypothetical protein